VVVRGLTRHSATASEDEAGDRSYIWKARKHYMRHRITGVSDFIHRPDFNNYKKKNKHEVSETGSVSVFR
jgi:hypothetical protein